MTTCPACGKGETDYPTRFDYTPVSHLACVEKMEAENTRIQHMYDDSLIDMSHLEWKRRAETAEREAERLNKAIDTEALALQRIIREQLDEIQQANREAAFWKWLATHEYRCPLGEMNPGKDGSYLIERHYNEAFLAHMRERWEREAS
jgi:hypothetical protein